MLGPRHRFPSKVEVLPVCSLTMPSKTSPTEVAWNPDTVYEFGLCRMQAHILGIWPLTCESLFAKMRLLVVAILEVTMMINLIRELRANCVAVDEVVHFVGFVGVSVLALLKLTVLRINQARMELLIRSALEDWSRVEDPDTRGIMTKHAARGRFVFIFQMTSAYATIVSLILTSLPVNNGQMIINNSTVEGNDYNYSNFSATSSLPPEMLAFSGTGNSQRSLPMGTHCFVADLPSVLYVLVYVVQVVQLSTTCAGNIGTDVYFFSIVLHVCAQFEVLKIGFEAFGRDPEVRRCREELETLVRRHNQLMTLSKTFEETFNLLILAQLIVNALHMSLLGLQVLISLESGDSVTAVGSLVAIYVLSLQLFIYSYAGDYLSTQTEKLRDAAYFSNWYDLPPTLIRDLIFVMSRSSVMFHLTAGKFYHMNIENFKNLLKAFASYFSMLRIVFEP